MPAQGWHSAHDCRRRLVASPERRASQRPVWLRQPDRRLETAPPAEDPGCLAYQGCDSAQPAGRSEREREVAHGYPVACRFQQFRRRILSTTYRWHRLADTSCSAAVEWAPGAT